MLKKIFLAFAVGIMAACNVPQVTYESIDVEAPFEMEAI